MKKVTHKNKDILELKTTGERIRFERTFMHMSQEDLAKYLYISREHVNRLENDSRPPSAEIIVKLSELFNVSADYLLCRTPSKRTGNFDISKTLGLTDEAVDRLKFFQKQNNNLCKTLNLLLTNPIATPFFSDCTEFLYKENGKINVTVNDERGEPYTLDFDTEELLLLEIQRTLRQLKNLIKE